MADVPVPRLRQVVVDTTDARASAELWSALLGLVYRPGHEPPIAPGAQAGDAAWINLWRTDGTPVLAFQQVAQLPRTTWPEPGIPQQLHLDLSVASRAELDAVHVRVLGLGGQLLSDRSADVEEPLRVYADPAGHPFCVFVVPVP